MTNALVINPPVATEDYASQLAAVASASTVRCAVHRLGKCIKFLLPLFIAAVSFESTMLSCFHHSCRVVHYVAAVAQVTVSTKL